MHNNDKHHSYVNNEYSDSRYAVDYNPLRQYFRKKPF